jgi:hypothetical protein
MFLRLDPVREMDSGFKKMVKGNGSQRKEVTGGVEWRQES